MIECDVRMQAEMYALVADMNAALLRMEGMKVANVERMEQGHTIAYNENAFLVVQQEIEEIGRKLREEI